MLPPLTDIPKFLAEQRAEFERTREERTRAAIRKIDRAFSDYAQAMTGHKPSLTLCNACSGTGTWGTYFEPCPTCGGDGRRVA